MNTDIQTPMNQSPDSVSSSELFCPCPCGAKPSPTAETDGECWWCGAKFISTEPSNHHTTSQTSASTPPSEARNGTVPSLNPHPRNWPASQMSRPSNQFLLPVELEGHQGVMMRQYVGAPNTSDLPADWALLRFQVDGVHSNGTCVYAGYFVKRCAPDVSLVGRTSEFNHPNPKP